MEILWRGSGQRNAHLTRIEGFSAFHGKFCPRMLPCVATNVRYATDFRAFHEVETNKILSGVFAMCGGIGCGLLSRIGHGSNQGTTKVPS